MRTLAAITSIVLLASFDLADEATKVLPIPARDQHKSSPPSGWCGETAIQEGLLHLGVWTPQALINQAGKPKHPDLYSQDLPVALNALGVQYDFYAPKTKGYAAYETWAKGAIDAGDPIIAGVKILPTEHPEWGLDHFVTVIGYGKKGLLVNTTWGSRRWVADTSTPGLSLKNAFYGIRLKGITLPKDGKRARLAVLDEVGTDVKLRVECSGFAAGASVRIERRKGVADAKPIAVDTVVASKSGKVEKDVSVAANAPARFACLSGG